MTHNVLMGRLNPTHSLTHSLTHLPTTVTRCIVRAGTTRVQVIEHVVDVHKSVIDVSHDFVTTLRRQNYVTPQNFLDFIATYQVTYVARRVWCEILTPHAPPSRSLQDALVAVW